MFIEEEVRFGWAFGKLDESCNIHVRAQPGAAHILQEGLFKVHEEGAAH